MTEDELPACVACGACCFTDLPTAIRVTGDDHARLGEHAETLTVWVGNKCYMALAQGHCAALTVTREGGFVCGIYEQRPAVCRDLVRGGGGCAAERYAKSERPHAALVTLRTGGHGRT